MAHSYKNIVITPNIGANSDPTVQFSGGNTTVNTDVTLRVYPDSNGTLSFEGSAGQLFSITNDLSGSVFSVNDVSGIPLIEVNVTSQQITFGEFYGNVGIGKAASTSSIYKLDVNGTINASNVLINGNAITGGATSLTPANNYANTVGLSSNSWANSVGTAGNNYASVLVANTAAAINNYASVLVANTAAAINNYASVLSSNNALGANGWSNTLSVTDRAIANAAANSANAYAVTVGAASNNWSNTLSVTDRAIANAAANSANAYAVTVGAASNNWANTIGTNTALAYTWTNTHTYQSTVSFSSNVFFRNTSNIVWITNSASTTSNVTLRNYPDSNGTLSFEGSAGQLFSITNDLLNSIFSVNDISGIPLIEVNTTSQQITFGEFYGNVGIGKTSSTSSIYKLDVNGTINASNVLINTVPVLVSLTPANNYANAVGTSTNNYVNTVVFPAANAARVNIGSTSPTNNTQGSLWWNQDYGRLLIYYNDGDSSQWVDASPANDLQSPFNVANQAFGQANTVYTFANTINTFSYNVSSNAVAAHIKANLAYDNANTRLSNTSGISFNGNLIIPGTLNVTVANAATLWLSNVSMSNAIINNQTTTISVGYSLRPYNAGVNVAAFGTWTPDPSNGNYQFANSNGAFTLSAPTVDCAIDILLYNGQGGPLTANNARTITFSGFVAPTGGGGDTYTTTANNKHILMIRRINGQATYSFKAMQ